MARQAGRDRGGKCDAAIRDDIALRRQANELRRVPPRIGPDHDDVACGRRASRSTVGQSGSRHGSAAVWVAEDDGFKRGEVCRRARESGWVEVDDGDKARGRSLDGFKAAQTASDRRAENQHVVRTRRRLRCCRLGDADRRQRERGYEKSRSTFHIEATS